MTRIPIYIKLFLPRVFKRRLTFPTSRIVHLERQMFTTVVKLKSDNLRTFKGFQDYVRASTIT